MKETMKRFGAWLMATALAFAGAGAAMAADYSAANQDEFLDVAAKAVSGDRILLGEGKFAIGPVDINGKTLTFKGVSEALTTVYIGAGGYDGNGGHGSNKTANMTFENLTLDDLASDAGYLTGFTEATGLTFRKVTFNVGFSNWGKGGFAKFYDCTFNPVAAGRYNIQELRSSSGTQYLFDGCVFNSDNGRLINAYKQGGNISIVVKNCTFKNTGSAAKCAINLKDNLGDGCVLSLTFVGANKTEGAFPALDDTKQPSKIFATTGAGNVTVTLKDTDDDEGVVIYEKGAKVEGKWIDPDGYVPAPAVSAVCKIGEVKYATLAEAVETAKSGDKIEMIDDVKNLDVQIVVPQNKSLTLDLMGKTISGTPAGVDEKTMKLRSVIRVDGGLTIEDSVGGGIVENTAETVGGMFSSQYPAVVGVWGDIPGPVGSVVVNGGTFKGSAAFRVAEGTITVNDCSVEAEVGAACESGDLVIAGGSFDVVDAVVNIGYAGTVHITDGVFRIDEWGCVIDKGWPDEIAISGGVFSIKPDQGDLAPGYEAVAQGTTPETWKVQKMESVPVVAKIGEVEYMTLEAAFAAVRAGETITLQQDVDLGMDDSWFGPDYAVLYLEVPVLEGTVVLDLNGKVIKSPIMIYESYEAEGSRAKLVIKNGTLGGVDVDYDGGALSASGIGSYELIDVVVYGAIQGSAPLYEVDCPIFISSGEYHYNAAHIDEDGKPHAGGFWNEALVIAGGVFDYNPLEFVEEYSGDPVETACRLQDGYAVRQREDGKYVVEVQAASVAKIGETEYATLAEAVAAVKAGWTVTLLANCAEAVTGGAVPFVLEKGGKSFTGSITPAEGFKTVASPIAGDDSIRYMPADEEPIITAEMKKVASGFYQNGAMYQTSTGFFITSKEGLEYFRDFVNDYDGAAESYIAKGFWNSTVDQLYTNSPFKQKTVFLLSDADEDGETVLPIGMTSHSRADDKDKRYFYGVFDGCEHTISNLRVVDDPPTAKHRVGLFGYLVCNDDAEAGVCNLTVENAEITGNNYIGGFIGGISGAVVVSNCHLTGSVTLAGSQYVGGILGHVGDNVDAQIVDCSVEVSEGSALTSNQAGGIIGYMGGGDVIGCIVRDLTINAKTSRVVGGIAGQMPKTGTVVRDCTIDGVTINAITTGAAGSVAGSFGAAGQMLLNNTVVNTHVYDNGTEVFAQCEFIATGDTTSIVGWEIEWNAEGKIIAGIFERIDDNEIADGYEKVSLGTTNPETWKVQAMSTAEVKIIAADKTVTEYETFAEAIAAANAMRDGYVTIRLVKDAAVANAAETPLALTRSSVAIDLAGRKLTVANPRAFKIEGSNVMVSGGQLACAAGYAVDVSGADVMFQNVASEGGICVSGGYGNFAVRDVELTAAPGGAALCARDGGVIIVREGSVIKSGSDGAAAITIPEGSTAHVIVKGGDCTGALDAASGLIDIRYGTFAGWTAAGETKLLVTGGTFDADPSAYVDSHYLANADTPSAGLWTVTSKYAAKLVGEDTRVIGWYEDLQTPVDMIRDGTTGVIMLLKPAAELQPLPEDVEVRVDENGDQFLVVYTYLFDVEIDENTKAHCRTFEDVCKIIEGLATQPKIIALRPAGEPPPDYKYVDNGTHIQLVHKVYTCQIVDKGGNTVGKYESYEEAAKDMGGAGAGSTIVSASENKGTPEYQEQVDQWKDCDWEPSGGSGEEEMAVTKEGYVVYRIKNVDNEYEYRLEVYVAQIGSEHLYTTFEEAIAAQQADPEELGRQPIVVRGYSDVMVAPVGWKFVRVQMGDSDEFHLVAKVYICSIGGPDGEKYETFEEAIDALAAEKASGELLVLNYDEKTMVAPSGWVFKEKNTGTWILATYVATGTDRGCEVSLKDSGTGIDRETITKVITDIFVAQKVETMTEVLGVKLTTINETNEVGEVTVPSGVQKVVSAAKEDAEENAKGDFLNALSEAVNVTIKVDVQVVPTGYVPASSGVRSGEMSFALVPEATVTVTSEKSVAVNKVPVTNDMIDQRQEIRVSLYTGFKPAQILHRDDNGQLIRAYAGKDIEYDAEKGVATVAVTHFSTMTALENPIDFVAKIGDRQFDSLAAAVAAANAGDVIKVIADVADETVTVDKSVTITSDLATKPVLNNVKLTMSGTDVELTILGLAFAGDSYVNANNGKALTLEDVKADVTPTKITGRGAFIVLGTSECTSGLDLTVKDCEILASKGDNAAGDTYATAIFGWAYLNQVRISGNTFFSAEKPTQWIVAKFMNTVDGAKYVISDNTAYGNSDAFAFDGFDFYQNNSRDNDYTVLSSNNRLYDSGTLGNESLAFVLEGNAAFAKQTDVTFIDSGSTLRGRPVTLADFEVSNYGAAASSGFYAVDVVFDEDGRICAGSVNRALSEDEAGRYLAPGFETVAQGTTPETWMVQEKVASPYWTDHAAATYSTPVDTANNILTIATAEELALFAKEVTSEQNAYNGYTVKIVDDIDLSAYEWVSIKARREGKTPYWYALQNAVIDGGNHTIAGMKIANVGDDGCGIGFLGEAMSLSIKDLTFDGASIDLDTERSQVGIVIGALNGAATIENVHVTNSALTAGWHCGAIIGFTPGNRKTSYLKGCTCANVTVTDGYSNPAGTIYSGVMVGCVNTGDAVIFEDGSRIKNDCSVTAGKEFIGRKIGGVSLGKLSEVDGWWYPTLADGIEAVEEDGEVVLLANCAEEIATDRTTGFTMKLASGVAFTGSVTGLDGYALKDNGDGTYTYGEAKTYVAEIFVNGESKGKYETLQAAMVAAGDYPGEAENPTIVQLAAGVVQEGNLSTAGNPLRYVTFQGADDLASSFKDCEIGFSGNSDFKWVGVTFRGILWDNARIVFSTFKNEGLTFEGNKFVNLKPHASEPTRAYVHFTAECKNFTYKNNLFAGADPTGTKIAAINSNGNGLTGNITITNNVLKDGAWRSLQLMFKSNDGVDDNFTITDNWFLGNAAEMQHVGSGTSSSDNVKWNISYNVFDDASTADSLTLYNSNPNKTTFELDHNFWVKNPDEYPGTFYLNGACTADNIASFGVYPYYANYDKEALKAGTKTVREALYNLIEPAIDVAAVISADGTTTNKFTTLAAAIAAAIAGEKIEMLCDATENTAIAIEKNLTIDLAGTTLTFAQYGNRIGDDALVTFKNGDIAFAKDGTAPTSYKGAFYVRGELTLDAVGIAIENCADYGIDALFHLHASNEGEADARLVTLNLRNSDIKMIGTAEKPSANDVIQGYTQNGGAAEVRVNLVNTKIKSSYCGYFAQYVEQLTLDGSTVTVDHAQEIVANSSGVFTLTNGSSIAVDTCVQHALTGLALVVNDGCTVDVKNAAYLGLNVNKSSVFKAGSVIRVANCCTTDTYESYKGKNIAIRADNNGKLTVEADADVICDGVATATAGSTIDIAGGRFKTVDAGAGAISLTGGVYVNEPDHGYAAEGYEVAANVEPFTKDDYPWAVAEKAFVPVDEKPITIDIKPVGQEKTTVPVKVSEEAVKAMVSTGIVVCAGEKATAAEVSAGLAKTQANDQTVWQNYVMGIDGTKTQNALATIGEKQADKPEEIVVVKTPILEFKPPQNTGVTVTYNLLWKRPNDTEFTVFQEGLVKPEFDVNTIELELGDTLWKFEAVFSAEKPK